MAERRQRHEYGMGRHYVPDERDARYPMRAVIRMVAPEHLPDKTIWTPGDVLDQGQTPTCVGHAWRGWMSCAPVTDRPDVGPDAFTIYNEAQKVDGMSLPHEGSTVRAGAQVLSDANNKALAENGKPAVCQYVWANTVDDIRLYILLHGPVVMGTNWLEDMFEPDPRTNIIRVSGPVAGGHAWLLHGFDSATGLFLMQNSWGVGWADKGHAWLHAADVAQLLAEEGEACTAVGEEFVIVHKPGPSPDVPVVGPGGGVVNPSGA